MYPLFQRFPGTEQLPRVELCDLPTPVERIANSVQDASISLSPEAVLVKRDDLTNATYGGNKVRKLELLLGQARAEQRRAVITFGAYGSNHALATAVYARSLGLEPHVMLSPQPPGPYAAATLLAHAGLGTVLHPAEGWDASREAVGVRRDLAKRDGIEPLVIPMGGTSALGAVAYVNAALELADQGALPDVVYVAGGTLGTAVGLAIGLAALSAREGIGATQVVAVRVTPEQVAADKLAADLATDTIALLRSLDPGFPELSADKLPFTLRHEFFEPGYGVPTPESREAVQLAARGGLLLETTYTGKAFFAMLDDIRTKRLDLTRHRVVFWDTYHSGPMPAPGPADVLPQVLRDYVAECGRLFGKEAS